MGLVGCCLSVPRLHSCGTILEKKDVETSFNLDFPVDYCPTCEIYSYHWGREDKTGIHSRDRQEVVRYVEDSQKIIQQKHLQNIARVEGFRERLERELVHPLN